MNLPQRGGDWGRLAAYVVFALVLYYLNVLFFLFAVPLQVLYTRKGKAQYVIASVAVLFGIAGFALWRSSQIGGGLRATVVSAEVLGALLFLAGLYVINSEWKHLRRKLYRMLIATGAVGLITLPLVIHLAGNAQFNALFHSQVAQVVKLLNASFGGGPGGGPQFKADELAVYIRQVALSNYLFLYFVILVGMWRLGTMFAMSSRLVRPRPLATFFVPVDFLWPIILAWTGVLAGRLLHQEVVHYVAWNIAMIGAFLYGLQGVGIVEHLFARFSVSRGVRVFFVVGVLILLLIPGVAMIVLVAFPILGISELWIHYGRGAANQEEESSR